MISKRRRRNLTGGAAVSATKKKKRIDFSAKYEEEDDDDEIVSSASEDEHEGRAFLHESSEEEEETVDAKRVRMARAYLDKLEQDVEEEESEVEESEEEDRIATTLQRERLLKRGTLYVNVADDVQKVVTDINNTCGTACKDWIDGNYMHAIKGHDLVPTCVSTSHGQPHLAVSGSKDHSVMMTNVETCQRLSFLQERYSATKGEEEDRNGGEVLSIATSYNGNLVAVGKRNATVALYDVRTHKAVTQLTGHKGPVTALAFQASDNGALFTGSTDRCIRHYNISELAHVETLYGHQAGVMGLDCLSDERPLSVGRDRTARLWKIQEDTHLIFRGGSGVSNAETCAWLNSNFFVTGHESDASIKLWSTHKKKPVVSVAHAAHRQQQSPYCSVTSLAACRQSDLVVSGSNDGYLRLYKTDTDSKPGSMDQIGEIPIPGFINGIAVGSNANHVVVAAGQEPRLGRWERVPKAKNRIYVVKLKQSEKGDSNSDVDASENKAEEEQRSSSEDEDESDSSESSETSE